MSFTEHHLYLDDVTVGQEWKSLGRTVTQADIVNFAGISGDFNPIHVDRQSSPRLAFSAAYCSWDRLFFRIAEWAWAL